MKSNFRLKSKIDGLFKILQMQREKHRDLKQELTRMLADIQKVKDMLDGVISVFKKFSFVICDLIISPIISLHTLKNVKNIVFLY